MIQNARKFSTQKPQLYLVPLSVNQDGAWAFPKPNTERGRSQLPALSEHDRKTELSPQLDQRNLLVSRLFSV
jgi:hypothetical protein